MLTNNTNKIRLSKTERSAVQVALRQCGNADIKQLLLYYRDDKDLTLRQVAKLLKVSHDMVFKLSQKYNVKFPKYRSLERLKDRLKTLGFDHIFQYITARPLLTQQEMADEVGMSRSWVKKQVHKLAHQQLQGQIKND